jgi:hypothetical protein
MVFHLQEGIEERSKRNEMRGKERTYIERESVCEFPSTYIASIVNRKRWGESIDAQSAVGMPFPGQ